MHLALSFLIACLLSTLSGAACASVVLTGTRIIYPAALSGKTLQLSNDDEHPWLVQMWLDAGNETSSPETHDSAVPFVLSPPIFRIEPNSGQAVRLMLTDAQPLPVDRESVFFLNFTQIPALEADDVEANKLVMLLRSRVKVFYRPRALPPPNGREIACSLRFHIDGARVEVENPSVFHAVVGRADLLPGGRGVPLLHGQMLPPLSHTTWPLDDAPDAPPPAARVHVSLVNDYGADERHDCPWR